MRRFILFCFLFLASSSFSDVLDNIESNTSGITPIYNEVQVIKDFQSSINEILANMYSDFSIQLDNLYSFLDLGLFTTFDSHLSNLNPLYNEVFAINSEIASFNSSVSDSQSLISEILGNWYSDYSSTSSQLSDLIELGLVPTVENGFFSLQSAIEGLELSPNITVECSCDCGGGGSGDDTGGGGSGDGTGGGGGGDSDGGSYSSELASIQASLDKLALESTLSSFKESFEGSVELFRPVHDYYTATDLLYRDSEWKPLRDNLSRIFDTTFFSASDSSLSYATVDFESNAVPHKVDISYSNMDFFEASLKFASDGNKINASATMLLKHLLDRMPDLKTKDTNEEESRITQSISETSQQLDSLRQSLELSEIKFKDTASEFFDGNTILRDLQNSFCPYNIILRIPEFMGFDEQVIIIPVSPIEPLLDVSRAVFGCVYFVLIAGFAWFAFRLFVPVLSRFSKLLAAVLNW